MIIIKRIINKITINYKIKINIINKIIIKLIKLLIFNNKGFIFFIITEIKFTFINYIENVTINIKSIKNITDFIIIKYINHKILLRISFIFESKITFEYLRNNRIIISFTNIDRIFIRRMIIIRDILKYENDTKKIS